MNTMKEDYVSFEISKLLKEKGFDIPCDYAYNNKAGCFEVDRSNFDEIYCFRPSLAMAMKWLREVHSLVICAEIGNENGMDNTDYSNPDRWYWFFDITNEKGVVIDTESDYILNEYSSYEQAVEAAIKYCLENLI